MSKPTHASPSLNGYILTNQFRKLRLRWDFTPLEAYLFYELVAVCNDEGWPTEFSAKNSVLTGALGCSEPGLIKARKTLASAGLIAYVEGQNRRPTAYRFCLAEGLTQFSIPASPPAPKPLTEFSIPDAKHLTECLTEFSLLVEDSGKHLTEGLTEGLTEFSPYIEQTKTETKEQKDAAHAAVSVYSSGEKSAAKRPSKKGLDHGAVAALALPHQGSAFADLWRTFYTENTHQQAKPVSALEKLLTRLGKWPEGAAVRVLEAAIENNWSGFAHEGATKLVDHWQGQQVKASMLAPCPVDTSSVLDPEAIAANTAAAQAAMRRRIAERQQRQAPA